MIHNYKQYNESKLEVEYHCKECNWKGWIPMTEIVTCPNCGNINDIWKEGEPIPERHKKLYKKYLNTKSNESIKSLLKGPSDDEILKYLKEKYRTPDKILKKSMQIKSFYGIKYALENGANINVIRDDVFEVVTDKYIDILKLLIMYNLDIHEHEDLMLISVAERTQEKTLKLLIESGCDVNAQDGKSLIFACNYGYYEIAKILVDNGADVHVKNEKPLKNAANVCYYKIMKLLLEHGADVEQIPESSIKRMIDCKRFDGLDLINEYKNKNRKKGLIKVDEGIKHLLIGPTEEQVLDNLKDNPRKLLQYSVTNNFKKGIEIALSKGANIHILITRDLFFLLDIMEYSDEQILDLLKDNKWDAMDYALHHKRYGIIKTLLNNGFEFQESKKEDLFTKNFEVFEYINNNIQLIIVGMNFVKKLISEDELESIKLLVKMGSFDIYWFGKYLLKHAKSLRVWDVVNYLNSININEGVKHLLVGPTKEEVWNNIKKLSPNERLLKSIIINYLEGVKDAIENGADIHYDNDYALRYVKLDNDIIYYLLDHGVDLHYDDENLLKRAVFYNQPKLVKYLIENGANIHTLNERPLKIASNNGFLEIVKILLDNGAEVRLSFIRNADERGHNKVSDILKKKYNEQNNYDIK